MKSRPPIREAMFTNPKIMSKVWIKWFDSVGVDTGTLEELTILSASEAFRVETGEIEKELEELEKRILIGLVNNPRFYDKLIEAVEFKLLAEPSLKSKDNEIKNLEISALTEPSSILKDGRFDDVERMFYSAGSATPSILDPFVVVGLTISGAFIGKITTVTDTYQVLTTDQTVVCNKATGFTVTMPAAAVGQIFNIKNIGVGDVTLTAPGTDTFDEVDADLTITQYDSLTLQCRLANKWILI